MGKILVLKSIDVKRLDWNCELFGISSNQLMERAGSSIVDVITDRFNINGKKIVIICGPGGNGGDGLTAARYLLSRDNVDLTVIIIESHRITNPIVKERLEVLEKIHSTRIVEVKTIDDIDKISDFILNADIIVDAIFGVGFKGKPREPYLSIIKLINMSKGFKVSVDVPSGLDADTGSYVEAVKANLTVTFVDIKEGMLKAKELCGDIVVVDLGIPWDIRVAVGLIELSYVLRRRRRNAHKGDYGRVLVIGGSLMYTGAPSLAALAALKAGADLAVVYAPREASMIIKTYSPDLIVIPANSKEYLTPDDLDRLKEIVDKFNVVILGPGMGLEEETKVFVNSFIELIDKPMVIDADAIKLLKGKDFNGRKHRVIITPHSYEFKLFTGRELPGFEKLRNRCIIVKEEAKRLNVVFLVKGMFDVISDGDRVLVNYTGNPLMTVGGTGDVLSGITAAFYAQANNALISAAAAAFINGLAGDLATKDLARLTPTSLLEYVDKAIKIIEEKLGVKERGSFILEYFH